MTSYIHLYIYIYINCHPLSCIHAWMQAKVTHVSFLRLLRCVRCFVSELVRNNHIELLDLVVVLPRSGSHRGRGGHVLGSYASMNHGYLLFENKSTIKLCFGHGWDKPLACTRSLGTSDSNSWCIWWTGHCKGWTSSLPPLSSIALRFLTPLISSAHAPTLSLSQNQPSGIDVKIDEYTCPISVIYNLYSNYSDLTIHPSF